ncbi:flagellar biosynthesis protein FlgL [Sulfurimonas sp. C5]|uniref:flagellin N-terminal helical domain-containing protein n=1 Tax=Sulfurimonas sp. C5 TaxID=3036947 RepID=UPI0024566225|nr:flagellar biosynthesis protein FlgL [Sulfurimonas sp. C5]MDH4943953.1 flagellar biosynthesis protein FlgL [Sulfurimonas sp. C5]
MRVTSAMYYNSIYQKNNSNLNKQLFDVNKQIASGLKIQYAHEDVTAFSQTMRLDNEITILSQVKQSTENGYKVSNQTDSIMNEFGDLMNRFRTLLIQATNDTNDETSRNAIANELRGLESNLRGLANTSINGNFLFSGSALDVKPIDDNGIYQGNADRLDAFVGSNNKQQFNISGADLFLGENTTVNREITTNVANYNLLQDYPALQASVADNDYLSSSSTMRQFMGDTDNTSVPANTYYFYVRGTKSDGTNFNTQISFSDNDKVSDLLDEIGKQYGNTGSKQVVNVSLNDAGEIVVYDKIDGSSKIDFHMVGAVDYSGAGAANVANIDLLDSGETNFDAIIGGTSVAANPNLFVKEFTKSGFTAASGAPTNIEGLIYDRAAFSVNGSNITSNVPQIIKGTNAFADASTKLSEVFDLSQGTAGTLDGTQLRLTGTTIDGVTPYDITININSAGSTFVDNATATSYDIFNMDTAGRTAVNGDDMTYQQLLDVVNMAITKNLPAGATATDYDNAIASAKFSGETYLTYDGKVAFKDLTNGNTKATISLYDANSGSFTAGAASVGAFQANNSLTVTDPKNDFFKSIDAMIRSVEEYKNNPNASVGSERVIGMQNAIARMDALQDHILSMHSRVGAQSNTLDQSLQRVTILDVTTKTLRSSVIDTDLAEASLTLQQLTTNYQAMLSTIGKVSQLSLVNYL